MQTNNEHVHGHTGRDAALGGVAGHAAGGHAGAGALAGGVLGHEHKDHKEDRAVEGKPTMGDKISGGMDKMVGKATHNPNKVAEGQAKTGTY